jgi:uncharacterized protein (TIGR02996 family)
MSTEGKMPQSDAALLQAVLTAPWEDEPRLRLADQLEAAGNPRGEFIRVQIALARLPEDSDECAPLRHREAELLLKHGERWASAPRRFGTSSDFVRARFGPRWGESDTWWFGRGFIEKGQIEAGTFLDYGEQLLAELPIRELGVYGFFRPDELPDEWDEADFDGSPEWVDQIAESPLIGRIPDLELYCCLVGDGGASTLISSPHLGGTSRLTLSLGFQTAAVAEALKANIHLRGLQSLALRYDDWQCTSGEFGYAGAVVLSRCDLPRLSKLEIHRGQVSSAGLSALLGSPLMANVEELEVSGNRLGAEGMRSIATSRCAERLRRLDLDGYAGVDDEEVCEADYRIGHAGAAALSQGLRFARLTYLNLNWNDIGADGVAALLKSSRFASLQDLALSNNEIDDDGCVAIAEATELSDLRVLDLGFNDIGFNGVAALSRSSILGRLRELDLSGNELDDRCLEAIASSPYLTNLRRLDLSSNPFTSAGLRKLLHSRIAGGLTHLSVGGHQGFKPDDETLDAIADSPYLGNVNQLELSFSNVSPAAAMRLANSNALPSLTSLNIITHDQPEVSKVLRWRWGRRVDIGHYYR